MKKKLREIAELIGGQLSGPPDLEIKSVSPLEEAGSEDLTFVFDKRRFEAARKSKAKALIVPPDFPKTDQAVVRVTLPKNAMAKILTLFEEKAPFKSGVHPAAVIGKKVKIGMDVYVGPGVVIEDGSVIGDGTILVANIYLGRKVTVGVKSKIYPGVVIYDNVTIGSRCIVHGNVVIGSDGFGYVSAGKKQIKIPQIGRVIIGDDVEIGANSTIDRATMGVTRIGDGTKIDNMVQIAHNVKIGKNCLLVSGSGIAGSSEIGDNVILAGQVGIADHVKVGSDVVATARAAVSKDVPSGLIVSGFPAQEFHKEMRLKAALRQVPKLFEKVKKLEQKIKN